MGTPMGYGLWALPNVPPTIQIVPILKVQRIFSASFLCLAQLGKRGSYLKQHQKKKRDQGDKFNGRV